MDRSRSENTDLKTKLSRAQLENKKLKQELALTRRLVFWESSTKDGTEAIESRISELADTLPQIIWISRADGTHVYFNSYWKSFTGSLHNHDKDEEWLSYFHPDDRKSAVDLWHHCLATGEFYETQYRIRNHSTQNYKWFLGRATPLHDETGEIKYWVGICTDIHDSKTNERKLEEAARTSVKAGIAKDRILAMISHELRTPVTAIMGWVRLLKSRKLSEENTNKALDAIDRSSQSQARLINDLFDAALLMNGKLTMDLEEINLDRELTQSLAIIQPKAMDKNIDFNYTNSAPQIELHADPARLQQVIWNLLNNSIKFTPSGGKIDVRVEFLVEQKLLCIKVQDSGRGIPPDQQESIFQLFSQAEISDDAKFEHQGLGLGLALSRSILKLHGGTLRVYSEGLGKGSTFTVELPVT